jgi:hypothetical protein
MRALIAASGLECLRVPLSGAAPGWGGDLVIGAHTFEVKVRGRGFRQLYRWLGDRHFGLIITADRHQQLLVVRLIDFLRQCNFRDSVHEARPKSSGAVSGTAASSQST